MLMSCEGNDNSGAGAASTAMRQAVKDFADAGGRVFGSHWHNAWVFDGPAPWPTVAKHSSGAHGFDDRHHRDRSTTSFPKGMAFAEWMVNVGGSTTPRADRDSRRRAQRRFDQPGRAAAGSTATDADKNTPMVQYFSFNTPVERRARAAVRPRRHERPARVGAARPSDSGKQPFPSGCMTTDADAAGEGAGVHAVRPVVVRDRPTTSPRPSPTSASSAAACSIPLAPRSGERVRERVSAPAPSGSRRTRPASAPYRGGGVTLMRTISASAPSTPTPARRSARRRRRRSRRAGCRPACLRPARRRDPCARRCAICVGQPGAADADQPARRRRGVERRARSRACRPAASPSTSTQIGSSGSRRNTDRRSRRQVSTS